MCVTGSGKNPSTCSAGTSPWGLGMVCWRPVPTSTASISAPSSGAGRGQERTACESCPQWPDGSQQGTRQGSGLHGDAVWPEGQQCAWSPGSASPPYPGKLWGAGARGCGHCQTSAPAPPRLLRHRCAPRAGSISQACLWPGPPLWAASTSSHICSVPRAAEAAPAGRLAGRLPACHPCSRHASLALL